MAFTRKLLKAVGLSDEQVESVMDAHTEVTNALVAERDAAKAASPDVEQLKKEVNDLKKQLETAQKDGAAKVQAEFDSFKQSVEKEKLNAAKTDAVKALLKDSGVQRDDFVSLLLGQVDMSQVELADGKVKDPAFVDALKTSYAGCFGTVEQRGAGAHNPPPGNGGTMTKDSFVKLSLIDQMRYANEHPNEYRDLK